MTLFDLQTLPSSFGLFFVKNILQYTIRHRVAMIIHKLHCWIVLDCVAVVKNGDFQL